MIKEEIKILSVISRKRIEEIKRSDVFCVSGKSNVLYLNGCEGIRIYIIHNYEETFVFWQKRQKNPVHWRRICLEEVLNIVDKEQSRKILYHLDILPQ